MSANRFDTLALHAGAAPDPATGARATPIYQTTSFTFRDSDHAAALFNMERAGHVYSRISNPTVAVFEERVAALENGAGAIGTASGQAALHLAIATLMGAGAQIAHEHRVPLLVDSTFTTPYLLKPFEHGADFIYHSATKFLGGHGTTIGGVLVDGGTFDFEASGRFPEFTEPYDGFHGMVFTEESTVAPFLLRARREGLRDFGACLHPQAAWQLLQGIETLPLSMERHVANTRRVVEFLAAHAAVETVAYPELPTHPDHALAKRLLPRGAGAVFSFNLRGDRAAGRAFIEALSLFSHLANVGDARSLVIHPASTTHFRMDAAALAAAGIAEGTIRLSIGLEDPDDLIDDLKRALKAAQKSAGGAAQQTASKPAGPARKESA